MITIDLSDIAQMLSANELEDVVADELQDIATAIYVDLTAPPPTGTPVLTGVARNGWQIDTSVPLAPEVYNRVAYINRLNNGHSQQSPSGFVDAILDKHTR